MLIFTILVLVQITKEVDTSVNIALAKLIFVKRIPRSALLVLNGLLTTFIWLIYVYYSVY